MKNIAAIVFFMFLLIVGFVSCSKKKEMSFRTITFSDRFYLSPDTNIGSLSVEINVEIPENYYNKEVLDNLRRQIVAKVFSESYTNLPIDSVVPRYVQTKREGYKEDFSPDFQELIKKTGVPRMDNEINIEGVTMFLDDKILSYSHERYAFMGGNNGKSSRYLYNFELINAHAFKEADIFIPNYQELLSLLIKEEFIRQSAEIESTADLNDFDFWSDRLRPNDNFYVSESGLVYVFNPYEISPYGISQTEVEVPFAKLKPILQQGNIIEYLYEHSTNNGR
ncbi:MAG: RsiV family protein [Paludibacteraceae bacterium]